MNTRLLRLTLRALALSAASSAALAAQGPGTEDLATPQGTSIATGSDTATGATSLASQPSAIAIAVPTGASVKQVLAYWHGYESSAVGGDDMIKLNGRDVTGTLIGGPTEVSTVHGKRYVYSYRADVTGFGLLSSGTNTVEVEGADFEHPTGAGLLAILGGDNDAQVLVRDGADVASFRLEGALAKTETETFDFSAAAVARVAELTLMVGNVTNLRPAGVWLQVGNAAPVVRHDILVPDPGQTFQSVIVPVDIPAGVGTVKVQLLSSFDPVADPVAGIKSDPFDGALDTNVWSFQNPLNDGTVTSTGTSVQILAPVDNTHDPWTRGNEAPRIMRSVVDGDMKVEAKWNSGLGAATNTVPRRYEMQGFLFEQEPGNYVRVEFVRIDSQYSVFLGRLINDQPAGILTFHDFPGPISAPMYMRVVRKGDVFTPQYSLDGGTFISLPSFTESITVNNVGLHSGNRGQDHVAEVEYFLVGPVDSDAGTPAELAWVNTTLSVPSGTGIRVCHLGPRFWKVNLNAWKKTPYSPDDKVAKVFATRLLPWPRRLSGLGRLTLREALTCVGGRLSSRSCRGLRRVFLQQAVAALLNAAHPDVERFWPNPREIILLTNSCVRVSARYCCILYYKAWYLRYLNWRACLEQ